MYCTTGTRYDRLREVSDCVTAYEVPEFFDAPQLQFSLKHPYANAPTVIHADDLLDLLLDIELALLLVLPSNDDSVLSTTTTPLKASGISSPVIRRSRFTNLISPSNPAGILDSSSRVAAAVVVTLMEDSNPGGMVAVAGSSNWPRMISG